jgi:hypothetical protein
MYKSKKYLACTLGCFTFSCFLFFQQCKRKPPAPLIHLSKTDGVIFYDSFSCFNGTNVVAGYYFADMKGNKIKERPADLCMDIDELSYVGIPDSGNFALFRHDSIIWKLPVKVHHEITKDEKGNILTLGYELVDFNNKPNMLFPTILTISTDGEIIKKQSLVKLFEQLKAYLGHKQDSILKKNKEFVRKHFPHRLIIFDTAVFHINSVQIIPQNKLYPAMKAFKPGNLLLSCFMNNAIMVVDRDSLNLLWVYVQEESFLGQHTARLDANGNISFFLNNLQDKKNRLYSSVRIINPVTKKIIWEFTGYPEYSLHSFTQGHCQFLPNGNVLITVNNEVVNGEGYVLEITRYKIPVWKWIPKEYKKMSAKREGFYRVERR